MMIANASCEKKFEVAGDQDRSAAEAVDPYAGWKREEHEGEEFDRSENRDLESRRVEDDDRRERDSEL